MRIQSKTDEEKPTDDETMMMKLEERRRAFRDWKMLKSTYLQRAMMVIAKGFKDKRR